MGQKTRDDAEQQLEKVGQQPLSSDSRDRFSLFFLCCCYCFQYRSDTFWFQGPLVRTTLRAHITYMPRSTYLLYHRWRGWGKKASKYLCCSLFPPIIQMIFLATSSVFFSLALSRSLYFSFPRTGKTLVFFFLVLVAANISLSLSLCQKLLVREKGESTSLGFQATRFEKKKRKTLFFFLLPFSVSLFSLDFASRTQEAFFFFFFSSPKTGNRPKKNLPYPVLKTERGGPSSLHSPSFFSVFVQRKKKKKGQVYRLWLQLRTFLYIIQEYTFGAFPAAI